MSSIMMSSVLLIYYLYLMKNLNNLISICIFLSLLILSCKNKTSPTNNKTVEELTPQSAPKKQFPKSTINLQAKGDENAP